MPNDIVRVPSDGGGGGSLPSSIIGSIIRTGLSTIVTDDMTTDLIAAAGTSLVEAAGNLFVDIIGAWFSGTESNTSPIAAMPVTIEQLSPAALGNNAGQNSNGGNGGGGQNPRKRPRPLPSKKELELGGEKYAVESELGEGGYGKVYKCRDPSGNVVAVKIIKHTKANIKSQEVQILGELRGPEYEPFIVQCFKTVRTDDVTYLVMEYFPDGSLEQYIRKNGCFNDENATRHFAHLVEGVRKLHEIGLVHRDLKPANILVARDKNNGIYLKIGDFGISKEGAANLLDKHTNVGTEDYIAPEVLQGRPYDKSADVYSLGATMHFMLKGKDPTRNRLRYNPCENPIVGRMMCQRREERLKLEDLEIRDGKLVEKTSSQNSGK